MRVHVITHVDFEGPGLVAAWADERRHPMTISLALTEDFPRAEEVDLLVIMGGPMSADEDDAYPFLMSEKRFIASVIDAGGCVLGICLGAQILSIVCGGEVTRAPHQEIGWYPVFPTEAGASDPVLSGIPEGTIVGHWHGDTFSVPGSAILALYSDACARQAFSLSDGRIVGLQFHMEWSEEGVFDLIERCSVQLDGSDHVMDAAQLIDGIKEYGESCRTVLFGLLDRMAEASADARRETA